MRHSKKLGLPEDFLQRSVETIINIYKEYYPELKKNKEKILNVFQKEFQKFGTALEKGLKEFEKIKQSSLKNNQKLISGADAFGLYQNFGFPVEFTNELANENGLEVDLIDFKKEEERHKGISRVSQEKKFKK